jgi:CxxC-x17-CxxC domain-containing protein
MEQQIPKFSNDITYFAETNFRNKKVAFGIKCDDRRRHLYIIGKTGMGKTTMLENMVLNDIFSGNGLCYVDPHGDSVEKFLDYIPSNRVNDVVYINPGDIDYPVAFNILETVDPSLKHIVASGLVGVFKKLWADSWGPRLEYVLRNTILALLDSPGSSLLGITRMLTDKSYRQKVVEKIRDPVVKAFWMDEFSKYPDRFMVEAIAPVQNKVGQFLSNFLIRNIVGQVKSSFDIRSIMDEGKILLLNLSKGKIGEDTSALLGAMIITKIQLAAMSRVDTPEEERRDFYLYVDEFQNFATESFANILSEARKYHLDLTIAHQYVEQLDEKVQAAVFGNVGTLISFRVGAADAELLAKEYAPKFTEEDVVNLAKAEIYLKLMIDGVASEPFSARGLPPIDKNIPKTDLREKIIRVSRERYAKSRKIVEDKIIRWSGVSIGEKPDIKKTPNIVPSKEKSMLPSSQSLSKQPRPMYQSSDHTPRSSLGSTSSGREMEEKTSAGKSAAKYLEFVAQQQASHGVNIEKDLIDRDSDGPTQNRSNAAQCFSCNKVTYVSFVPDSRPVYCKECLRAVRLKKAMARTNVQGDLRGDAMQDASIQRRPETKVYQRQQPPSILKTSGAHEPVRSEVTSDAKLVSVQPRIRPEVIRFPKKGESSTHVKSVKPGEVVKFGD